jgi:hypothetical protein
MTARRLQGALAVLALVAAVVATAVCVVRPPASSASASTSDPASAVAPTRLPPGTRVEVHGGDPFAAYRLADRLIASGAVVGSVDPVSVPAAAADPAPAGDGTTIVYYDRRQLPTAEQVRRLVGGGTLRHAQVFQPVVDVTIVLGKDLSRA